MPAARGEVWEEAMAKGVRMCALCPVSSSNKGRTNVLYAIAGPSESQCVSVCVYMHVPVYLCECVCVCV